MNDILKQIPSIPKSDLSLKEQLEILCVVGNKIGLFEAVDATNQLIITDKPSTLKYGCYCDVEVGKEAMDDCVIDTGNLHDCIFAKKGMRKEQCEYWLIK